MGADPFADEHAPPGPLPAASLYRRTDPAALPEGTSAELPPLPGLALHPRAAEAVRLGQEIAARGFNIFAIGSDGTRIKDLLRPLLQDAARQRPAPQDWVYVNNFATPHRPTALSLPPGQGPTLRAAMREMVADLRSGLPAVFEGEDFDRRRAAIQASLQAQTEQAFATLGEAAAAKDLAIVRTPEGFAVAPAKEGKIVPPDEFHAWPKERQQAVQADMAGIEKQLEETLRSLPRFEKQRRDALRGLERETARFVIDHAVEEARGCFTGQPAILDYLETVRADLPEHLHLFLNPPGGPEGAQQLVGGDGLRTLARDRYDVNVFVCHEEGAAGAPLVEELHPILGNLLGRVEHHSDQGVLMADFRLIKAGSLHRANGGIILVDARAMLADPFSWPALKRALLQQRLVIEDPGRFLGLTTTVSLEPDPIPLDLKLVLFGDRQLYYLLAALDPELEQHVKVLADLDDVTERTPENEALLARMAGELARREQAPPLDRGGLARLVEHAARQAEDASRLHLSVERLRDLVVEAGHWARQAGKASIGAAEVAQAIAGKRRRGARIEEYAQDMIRRGVALIDTAGSRVGQVNGLSVTGIGGQAFGRPSRITARVRPGAGRILDIEREVELGGPIHSKGVLILGGFLAGRFATDIALSLQASLVFEQSYGGVDGDSASLAELCVLLSALAELPLRQDIAVTGSINQHGEVQAVGGVNEKIEGFFDLCAARGLTGTQGVVLPAANVQHLMLHQAVVRACAEGRFAVWPVHAVDQAMALLTGRPAGTRDADGGFTPASVNRLAEQRLRHFAELRRHWAEDGEPGKRRRD